MSSWGSAEATAVDRTEEVHVVTRRKDGTLRTPRVIWAVADTGGGRVWIRSTNGRTADWFRWALATGEGQLLVGGRTYDVAFDEADGSDLDTVDQGYRRKYGRYASIVDHLCEEGPRAATLELRLLDA